MVETGILNKGSNCVFVFESSEEKEYVVKPLSLSGHATQVFKTKRESQEMRFVDLLSKQNLKFTFYGSSEVYVVVAKVTSNSTVVKFQMYPKPDNSVFYIVMGVFVGLGCVCGMVCICICVLFLAILFRRRLRTIKTLPF